MRSIGIKSGLSLLAAAGALLASSPALAQASCDRATMQDIADRYEKAQAEGSLFQLPVGEWVDYRENLKMSSSATGVLSKPMNFARTVQLLDTQQCQAFVKGVITQPQGHVLATVVNNGFFGVNQVSTVVGTEGAAETLAAMSAEDWGEIPEGSRAERAQLVAAANGYLDGLGREVTDRTLVVDVAKGGVGVFGRRGSGGPAVSYTIRIENGAVRYAHESVAAD
jgi:hypothetical protein